MLVLAWQVGARGLTHGSAGVLLDLLDTVNFVFHEGGHVLFVVFGSFLTVLGGSLTQVALPAACTVYFWRAGRLAAAAATLFWAGESLSGVAIYVADARARALPLHGGPGVIHDWHYLLSRLGALDWASELGWATFLLAVAAIAVALGLLARDLRRLLAAPPEGEAADL
jgi:hypothetical protein